MSPFPNENPLQAVIKTPIGKLGIQASENSLKRIRFLSADTELLKPSQSFVKTVVDQLLLYFADPNYIFELNYQLMGTEFQKTVWRKMLAIPVAKTRTYGDLAKELSSGPRAIGNACRHNPLPILIPCHRIVGAQGLGGFAGDTKGNGIAIKRWLLQHEEN